jgi:hypothetical protein
MLEPPADSVPAWLAVFPKVTLPKAIAEGLTVRWPLLRLPSAVAEELLLVPPQPVKNDAVNNKTPKETKSLRYLNCNTDS